MVIDVLMYLYYNYTDNIKKINRMLCTERNICGKLYIEVILVWEIIHQHRRKEEK